MWDDLSALNLISNELVKMWSISQIYNGVCRATLAMSVGLITSIGIAVRLTQNSAVIIYCK